MFEYLIFPTEIGKMQFGSTFSDHSNPSDGQVIGALTHSISKNNNTDILSATTDIFVCFFLVRQGLTTLFADINKFLIL